jgi:hypothetical protein
MRFLICIALAAMSLSAAQPEPVEWKLVDGPGRPVKPGAHFTVTVQADVQPGWYVRSLRPMSNGRASTRIWIAQGQLFLIDGIVQPPDAILVQDPRFDVKVESYVGETAFTLPLRVPANSDAAARNLFVHVSYQACNNQICLPPKEVELSMRIDIVRGRAPF